MADWLDDPALYKTKKPSDAGLDDPSLYSTAPAKPPANEGVIDQIKRRVGEARNRTSAENMTAIFDSAVNRNKNTLAGIWLSSCVSNFNPEFLRFTYCLLCHAKRCNY